MLRHLGLLVAAVVASTALVLVYLALGGGGYEPSAVADPCASRAVPAAPEGAAEASAVAQHIVLVGLDRTACRLGTSREALALALVDPDGVEELLVTEDRTSEEISTALQEGVGEAVADATAAGVVDEALSTFLTGAVDVMPVDQLVRWATTDDPPCEPVRWGDAADDLSRITARIALDGIARAACTLDVPIADVVVAVSSTDTLAVLAEAAGAERGAAEQAVRQGLLDAIDDAVEADALEASVADVLRAVIPLVPVDRAVALIRGDVTACEPIELQQAADTTTVAARIGVLAALNAACKLEVGIEDLLVDLSQTDGLARLAERTERPADEVEATVRTAVREAVDEGAAQGSYSSTVRDALIALVDVVPIDRLLATIRGEDVRCLDPAWRPTETTSQLAAQIVLIGVADAACTLDRSLVDLAMALASAQALDAYLEQEGLERDAVEDALRDGLTKGVDVAEDHDAVNSIAGFVLEPLIDQAPLLDLLQLIESQLG